MDKIVVKKIELLEQLRSNRQTHVENFKDTLAGYREKTVKDLKKAARLIKAGKSLPFHINFNEPESHESDYTRTIQMLEMDVSDVVELDRHEFDQYVNDNWNWKGQFDTANTLYNSKLRRH